MDPNESSGLNSYYQQQPPQQQTVPPPPSPLNPGLSPIPQAAVGAGATTATGATTNASPTNGMLPNNPSSTANNSTAPPPSSMVYPHSAPSAVSSTGGLESVKRKRGRPRKYGTPEQAAAAKRLSSSSSAPMSSSRKNNQIFNSGSAVGSSSSKRFQLSSLGNPGQSFTPHVITVATGEDVSQKIMLFQEQSKREICILSASGAISNANLRQPSSGGFVTIEGRYEILSLSGSYVRNGVGGKAGGLSVCLASSKGEIVGGGVCGLLRAAGPIQVIVGTFQLDGKKDVMGATKGDGSAGKLPSPIAGASFPASGVSFRSPIDSSSYQNLGGQFMIQPRSSHFEPAQSLDWIRDQSGNDVQPSPENGNYDHIPDLRN